MQRPVVSRAQHDDRLLHPALGYEGVVSPRCQNTAPRARTPKSSPATRSPQGSLAERKADSSYGEHERSTRIPATLGGPCGNSGAGSPAFITGPISIGTSELGVERETSMPGFKPPAPAGLGTNLGVLSF